MATGCHFWASFDLTHILAILGLDRHVALLSSKSVTLLESIAVFTVPFQDYSCQANLRVYF
jgi:hypothetical protein